MNNSGRFSRRSALVAGGAGAAALIGASLVRGRPGDRTGVFIGKAPSYNYGLERLIRDGLTACGLVPAALREKRVLLKPNMVEPDRRHPHLTTHPALVAAAAEVFRGWGASVGTGEGPGHIRDTELALVESRLEDVLDTLRLPFADFNYQRTGWAPNRGGRSRLAGFHFPQSVLEADLIVSMPKAKTHHWVGLTGAMKNLYGTLPGLIYGWPKNVLHQEGIPETVYDINASLPPTIAIVDAIDCMEGDGPILGTPKHLGLVVIGVNAPAVDATLCRLMDLEPQAVPYLELADGRLGPIGEARIEQRGEPWERHRSPFAVLDKPHLRAMLNRRTSMISGKFPWLT